MNKKYGPEIIGFIKENAEGKSNPELAGMIFSRFGRSPCPAHIKEIRKRLGIGNLPRGKFKGSFVKFSPEIVSVIAEENNRKTPDREIADLVNAKFGASFTVRQIISARHRRGLLKNARDAPLFSEKADERGCIRIKVSDEFKGISWELKHRWLWERANGKIPEGHVVVFADGNKSNFELDNLICVPRNTANCIIKTSLFFTDPECVKTGVMIAELAARASRRKKNAYKNALRRAKSRKAKEAEYERQ